MQILKQQCIETLKLDYIETQRLKYLKLKIRARFRDCCRDDEEGRVPLADGVWSAVQTERRLVVLEREKC